MPTRTLNSNAGRIIINARTDETLRITMLDPDGAAKAVNSFAYRAVLRHGRGGRVVKTWNTSTSGGITIPSGSHGIVQLAMDKADVPPMREGMIEVVEYSGKTLSGDPTDRFRFFVTAQGGSGEGY